jgi:hypothetical protein
VTDEGLTFNITMIDADGNELDAAPGTVPPDWEAVLISKWTTG